MRQFTLLVILLITGLFQVALAQNRNVSGRVTDRANNQGLPGVTVLVKGTTLGTATGNDGTYTISVPPTATTLTFSYIGYTSAELPIGNGTVNAALASDVTAIGEVVVTGALGIQRQEREVGYATATLNTAEITQARPTNFVNGLTGKVSGLQVQTLSAGVNPEVRVTLRGTRSITGDNQALVVIDGIISTNQVLAALNPDDVASTTILKGATAAALYGSQASNGALIITTKRGGTTPQITLSQTSTFESISFLPKFQNEFGPGSPQHLVQLLPGPFNPNGVDDYTYQYQGFENQQFGPRYDGSRQPFGEMLADGSVDSLTYEARPDEKRKFFNTGFQMQNGISFSGGDERTKFFASYQNVHNNGIVPKDKFDRNSFRFNASRELNRLTVGFNINYSQQKSDITSNADRDNSVYWNIFNTTSMAPITRYKDWQNDKFANPNGYFNAYYFNPYWIIDNNRTTDRRNTLVGNIDLSYRLTDWLRVQYRIGTTNVDQSSLATQNKFIYNTFVTGGNTNKSAGSGTTGYVQDFGSYFSRINSDLFVSMDKTFGNVNVKAIVGNNVQRTYSRFNYVASTGLASPDLFNLQNRVGNLTGSDATAETRLYAFYADLTLGFKDFFYLHGSGRNDNTSVLEAANRSFFYPSVDASLVLSNAIPALKDASFLDFTKLRGGISKTSQVNLGGAGSGAYNTNGAYRLLPTYSLGSGFPYGSLPSFTAGNQLVQPGLTPETTISTEAGIELSFFKSRISGAFTYYNQKSTGQTIAGSIAPSTGYTSYLLNAGEVRNNGIEVDLNFVPVRTAGGLTVTVGGNFNYNNNDVVSLPNGDAPIALSSGGNANVYAIVHNSFPVLQGSYYERVADGPAAGRVKMQQLNDEAGNTRYMPVKAADIKSFGNTQPKYKYGFNASVSYKGLTLAGQGEMRTGYVVYHSIGENMDFAGSSERSAQYGREAFLFPNSAISTDGGVTYAPNTGGLTTGGVEFWGSDTYNTTVAENYVTSGKFFKIRELSLSYSLPGTIVSKIGFVKGLSLNAYGRNIFTWVPKENQWTDPEFNFAGANSNAVGINTYFQTPPTKFYGASLSATF